MHTSNRNRFHKQTKMRYQVPYIHQERQPEKIRKDCTKAMQIHRVLPLGSIHVVEPTLFTQQYILYIFNIVVAPHLTALHEL